MTGKEREPTRPAEASLAARIRPVTFRLETAGHLCREAERLAPRWHPEAVDLLRRALYHAEDAARLLREMLGRERD